ncbi:UDP-glycosyltransferase 72B3-like [Neltuma alba]|uniref:UDP-glycosyltransferase 72B3-like n=1 Tax=Neltuma alba TaxID=207710 RepID=UPI0010A2DB6F|nr:UDP-glycosyltransferase 72B3-like [Prosopis alba]
MVPCPGFSHLIPLVQLAKRLVVHRAHFHVTLFIPTLGPPSKTTYSILQSLPPHIDFTILPQVNQNDIPQSAVHPATQIHHTVMLSLPSFQDAFRSLNSRTHLFAMIADLLSVDALEMSKQFNLKSYIYYASGATSLCFCLNFPELHQDHDKVSTGFRELSLHSFSWGKDIPDIVQERSSESYETILHICKRFNFADGIIVNSILELELEIELATANMLATDCLTWLNNPPQNSVLYISFGSGGSLSHDQLRQLALGLEISGHKFLWVVRAPSEFASSDYLRAKEEDPLDYLPKGFIERTKDQGFVVPSWAPQIEILRHESVGGFLTHCGGNSTPEGVF